MFHKEDGRRLKSFDLNLLPHTQRSGSFAFATAGCTPPLVVMQWSVLVVELLIVFELGAILLINFLSCLTIVLVVWSSSYISLLKFFES